MRLLLKIHVCVFLLVATACSDNATPTGIRGSLRIRALIVPPGGAVQLGTQDSTPAASKVLPSYPDPVIVQVGVSGTISMTSANNTWYSPYTGPVDGSGIFVYGYYACYVNVTFSWSGQGLIGPGPCRYPPSPLSTWGDTVLVSGNGTVTRGPGVPQHPSDCNWSQCHTYSGFQSAWVLPLHATLGLTAFPDSGMAPARISFVARVNPSSIKNIAVPLRVLSWQWTAAGGGSGQTLPCAQPVNPCVVTVMESGTMQLTALANGEEQTANASVGIWEQAPPCPAAVLANHPLVKDEYYVVNPPVHNDPHLGRDHKADIGTEVRSARNGIVRDVQSRPSTGLRVIIESTDGSNRLSYYYHLRDATVTKGANVNAGDLIAHSGQSGKVTGPHLHFEEHINTGHLYDPVTGKAIRTNVVQPCTF